MKSQKISWTWVLGPRNYIWVTLAQKTCPAISSEPWLQFLHTGPRFLKNNEINPIKLWNLKKCLHLVAWALKLHLGYLGPEDVSNHKSRAVASIFTKGPHFLQNHNMNPIRLWNFKKFHDSRVWRLETIFGLLGPKRHI